MNSVNFSSSYNIQEKVLGISITYCRPNLFVCRVSTVGKQGKQGSEGSGFVSLELYLCNA